VVRMAGFQVRVWGLWASLWMVLGLGLVVSQVLVGLKGSLGFGRVVDQPEQHLRVCL